MAVSRRAFLASLGASSAGALVLPALPSLPLIGARGRETLHAFQGTESRRADRLLATRPGMVRLDSNENPNGPGSHVFAAIGNALGHTNRYPVKEEDDLIAAIAKKHGVKPEHVVLGCGSGELLRAAVQAFTSTDRALVVPRPTFEAPEQFAAFISTPVRAVPVDAQLRLDLDGLSEAAKGAGLVYLCNPNNPTATLHGKADISAFIEQVGRQSPNTVILVDEAYHEYVDDPSHATAIPIALENPRVVITRTFSKVFGMAGMRAGYAVAKKETLARMTPWLLGSNVNQLALAAAHATVGDMDHVAKEAQRNREVRAYTMKYFKDAGFSIYQCEANFMMVDIRRDVKAFKLECVNKGVAVGRPFPPLNSHVRVSFGTMNEMKKALHVFRTALA